MIPPSFVEQLLARVDIVDVIERYVPLKKGGANYLACCPFHNEKSPSFTVSPSKQFYHCFGCGAHGTAIGFLMEYGGTSFRDTVKELASQVGMQMPDEERFDHAAHAHGQSLIEVMATAARFYRSQLKTAPAAIEYLKKRGLTGEIAARFGIGYAGEDWQSLRNAFPGHYDDAALIEAGLVIQNDAGRRYDRFRERITFPILDQRGNVIGFGGRIIGAGEPKYLNSPETPLFEKGRELYGLWQARQAIRESSTVVVVEGYMDVVALAQFGFGAAVATLGTATTPTHIQKLFRQAERIVFCFDGDTAGRKAARRALDASLEQLSDDKTVRFLFLPPEHDPDSYVRENGLEAFRRAVEDAMPLTEFLMRELRQDNDLTTAEGRARLVHVAKDFVPRVAAPVLRLQLIRALAEDSGLPEGQIETALGLKTASGKPRKAAPRQAPRTGPVSPLRQLLRVLAAYPNLCGHVPFEVALALEDSPEKSALLALLDAFDDGALEARSLAMFYERFRDTPVEAVFGDLLSALENNHYTEDTATTVLSDLLLKHRLHTVETRIAELNQRMASRGPNPEELQQLQTLLKEKQKLKSGQAD
ncbi:DNA primase [Uliginosibacterium sp. sgz301328]|uniref:DNA primase n=1 Tax=Uliginosibacterium sp. sgz301328 TaxID=3243764 RepID=UPI00359E9C34